MGDIVRGVDEPDVGERLGKVADQAPSFGVVFLGEQAHVVAQSDQSREQALRFGDAPEQDLISQAFWHACAAGQRRGAQRLLEAGADINWTPDYAEGTPFDVAGDRSTRQQNVIDWLKELGARSGRPAQSADQD